MKKILCLTLLLLSTGLFVCAQEKKYPSLLWEITGNGLQKPSYLFGTMHVSNKMAFHLSDSFYTALQQVDVVALEQNPQYWQRDMMRMNEAQNAVRDYMTNGANDYLNKESFQLAGYEDNLRAALTDQPMQINGLLYRTSRAQDDYEENTYLDLYIYQTGRKLGKQAAGVEDYYESQRMVFKAYQAAANDQNTSRSKQQGEQVYDLQKKIQEAYRQGNLDMLDSLGQYEYASPAFTEIFLYRRNEVQAHSIDTIIQKRSLFVGVGAAHLPGSRGVIELLRKKGYRLRPIFMTGREAAKKEAIDTLRVPVVFSPVATGDGTVGMLLPGPLFKRADSHGGANESWQYADMDNGTYYTLTRVKTHAALLGESPQQVMQKLDNLLYEHIPGRILSKKAIVKSGYRGFDIINRTRRGDMQRYHLLVTPFEVLVFKMSGNEDYVAGAEADTFFQSIRIQNHAQHPLIFTARSGGFSAALPHQPYETLANSGSGQLAAYVCEATDSSKNITYLIWKKTVNNYHFLEEDTFDLSLIEASLAESNSIARQLKRSFGQHQGYRTLDMQFLLKNGSHLYARAVLRGAHYYLLAATTKDKKYNPEPFFSSFRLQNFEYSTPQLFADTVLHYTVKTPVKPALDTFVQRLVNEASGSYYGYSTSRREAGWSKDKTAFFQHDSTGEAVLVTCTIFPKYFAAIDTALFWENQMNLQRFKHMVVRKKEALMLADSATGYSVVLTDTNTVRQILMLFVLKNNYLYQLTALSDTAGAPGTFIRSFFTSFRPGDSIPGKPVFEDKTGQFFADYYSEDSAVQKEAANAVSTINYNCKSLPMIQHAIESCRYTDKAYFDQKTAFIHELGYLNDSACVQQVTGYLLRLYRQLGDTSIFQNEITEALARLQTATAYDSLKPLLLADPLVYDDDSRYHHLFALLGDSLKLAARLFPDLLQLAAFDGYKAPVNGLLQQLVDSGWIRPQDYRSYFGAIYFDAKIVMKKQQIKEDEMVQQQKSLAFAGDEGVEDENDVDDYAAYNRYHRYVPRRTGGDNGDDNALLNYAALLVGFYHTHDAVAPFFNKLLRSQDQGIQLGAALLLARNHIGVADTVWQQLAASDKYRAPLYEGLNKLGMLPLFPAGAATQVQMARSLLLNENSANKFFSCEWVGKKEIRIKSQRGFVHFFKYKLAKDDDWKIGISGWQPANPKAVGTNKEVTKMTGKTLATGTPLFAQYEEELKKLVFALYPSAARFYNTGRYGLYTAGYDNDAY